MQLKVNEIRQMLGLAALDSDDTVATGYSIDSRTIQAGEIFIAIHGEKFDGHAFVQQVLQNKAIAAVVAISRREQLASLPQEKLVFVESTLDALQLLARRVRERWHGRVIGVTGSVGKTTTKEAIAKVLASKWPVLKSQGNLNNGYGMPLQLLKVQPEDAMAVLEMGMSSAGEIAALCRIAEPDWGVVTVVAPVHTEFFADGIAGVGAAKRELVEALPASGVAFLNADDARVAAFAAHTRARLVTFGCAASADVRATNIQQLGADGTAFTIVAAGQQAECRLRLVGVHNVTNALAAAAVGIEAGMPLAECCKALGEMLPPDSRGQTLTLGGAYLINDCYNSNPLALDAMVKTLAGIKADRRIVVAGEMLELGPDADALHAGCGTHAAQQGMDVLIGVRGHAQAMVAAAQQAGMQAVFVPTPEEAGEWLAANLRPQDAVLLKASRGVRLERALERLVDRLRERAVTK